MLQTTRLRLRPREEHQCLEPGINGGVCGRKFSRRWNLKRHIQTQHMTVDPSALVGTHYKASLPFGMAAGTSVAPEALLQNEFDISPAQRPTREPHPPSGPPSGNLDISTPSQQAGEETLPSIPAYPPCRSPICPLPGTADQAQLPAGSGVRRQGALGKRLPGTWPDPTEERISKRPRADKAGRPCAGLGRAVFTEIMPAYDVKRSKTHPQQQRGLQWLSQEGKLIFDQHLESLMRSWGVKPRHSGTCVLWPQDWMALDPEKIAEILTYENCPLVELSNRSVNDPLPLPPGCEEAYGVHRIIGTLTISRYCRGRLVGFEDGRAEGSSSTTL